jgi:hypothetical protein
MQHDDSKVERTGPTQYRIDGEFKDGICVVPPRFVSKNEYDQHVMAKQRERRAGADQGKKLGFFGG